MEPNEENNEEITLTQDELAMMVMESGLQFGQYLFSEQRFKKKLEEFNGDEEKAQLAMSHPNHEDYLNFSEMMINIFNEVENGGTGMSISEEALAENAGTGLSISEEALAEYMMDMMKNPPNDPNLN